MGLSGGTAARTAVCSRLYGRARPLERPLSLLERPLSLHVRSPFSMLRFCSTLAAQNAVQTARCLSTGRDEGALISYLQKTNMKCEAIASQDSHIPAHVAHLAANAIGTSSPSYSPADEAAGPFRVPRKRRRPARYEADFVCEPQVRRRRGPSLRPGEDRGTQAAEGRRRPLADDVMDC